MKVELVNLHKYLPAIIVLSMTFILTQLNVEFVSNMVNDNFNVLLLTVICLLVSLIDIPLSIVMLFCMVSLTYWFRNPYENFEEVVEGFPRDTVPVVFQEENTNSQGIKYDVETIEPFSSNSPPEGECLTQEDPSLAGADVVGCRYDSSIKAQNASVNGPPLSDCRTYDVENVKNVGTVFYPLNG